MKYSKKLIVSLKSKSKKLLHCKTRIAVAFLLWAALPQKLWIRKELLKLCHTVASCNSKILLNNLTLQASFYLFHLGRVMDTDSDSDLEDSFEETHIPDQDIQGVVLVQLLVLSQFNDESCSIYDHVYLQLTCAKFVKRTHVLPFFTHKEVINEIVLFILNVYFFFENTYIFTTSWWIWVSFFHLLLIHC